MTTRFKHTTIGMEGLTMANVLELVEDSKEEALVELYQRIRIGHSGLAGKFISVSNAADQYGTSIHFWHNAVKAKRVEVVKPGSDGRGNVTELNAWDVAVFWDLYNLLRNKGYLLAKVYRAANSQLIAA